MIRDKIHELAFEISPLSFFQNKPSQTDVFSTPKALEYSELTGNETVFDIYCGIGTISCSLAGKAAKVVGIESVESAISDARRNADLNGIEHTEFHGQGRTTDARAARGGVTADVVVMDPPARVVTRRCCRPCRHGAAPPGHVLQPQTLAGIRPGWSSRASCWTRCSRWTCSRTPCTWKRVARLSLLAKA